MSWDYEEKVNANLVCPVCLAPFVNPRTTRECGHSLCSACVANLAAGGATFQCPLDRATCAVAQLRAADPIVRRMLDELRVKCLRDCGWTGARCDADEHCRRSCPAAPSGGSDQRPDDDSAVLVVSDASEDLVQRLERAERRIGMLEARSEALENALRVSEQRHADALAAHGVRLHRAVMQHVHATLAVHLSQVAPDPVASPPSASPAVPWHPCPASSSRPLAPGSAPGALKL